MDIRKKIFSIVGVLTLTMSMTAGIAFAEDAPTSSSSSVTITVVCATTNADITTYSLGTNPSASNANFDDFDPSGESVSSSTSPKALRLTMNIAQCESSGWSFSANITDFKHATSETSVISGSNFSLPAGEPNASEVASSSDGLVPGVVGPVSNVTFQTSGAPDADGLPTWNGSVSIASHDGASDVSGEMYMDYTGVLSNLGGSELLESGTYTAKITVTFVPGGQP